jgi:hypothetical protein
VTPLITIILPTDTADRIRPVLDHLGEQSLDHRVEILVVITRAEAHHLERPGVTILPVDSVYPLSSARAVGVRAAAGQYVFMGETHSFPRAGMFTAIAGAHETGATIVVPALENENPDGLVSWACFLSGYASWTGWRERGVLETAPLFNVSYLRSFLLSSGDSLGRLLLVRENISRSVAEANGTIFFEPSARIGHVNIARPREWLAQRIVAGRTIGSVRSLSWSGKRKLAFGLAFPLIPFVLLRKHWRGITRTIRGNGVSPLVVPAMMLGMFFQAWGEMLGYLLGESASAVRRYDEYEVRQLDLA